MGEELLTLLSPCPPLTLSILSDVIVDSVRRTRPAVAQSHPHSLFRVARLWPVFSSIPEQEEAALR